MTLTCSSQEKIHSRSPSWAFKVYESKSLVMLPLHQMNHRECPILLHIIFQLGSGIHQFHSHYSFPQNLLFLYPQNSFEFLFFSSPQKSSSVSIFRTLVLTFSVLTSVSHIYSPPPVLDMPATFNLELVPGQHVALETTVSDEFDMSRMDDGTVVDGSFWGKLDIVHDGDTHKMEFSGTRIANNEYSPDFLVDSRVITKLAVAAKPSTAKCHLSILAPAQQYCDVVLSFSTMWTLGVTWPPAESLSDNKVKYFLRVHPGGAIEHFESEMVATSLYYEVVYVLFP